MLPVALAFGYLYAQREPAKSRFYVEDNLEWDMWELPIIDPLYLTTTVSQVNPSDSSTRWNFSRHNIADNFHPDSINYQSGFITFHDSNQRQYGFYDLQREKTTFLSSQQFADFARLRGISPELYEVEAVYRCWYQTAQLPWAKEIFIQNYGSTARK